MDMPKQENIQCWCPMMTNWKRKSVFSLTIFYACVCVCVCVSLSLCIEHKYEKTDLNGSISIFSIFFVWFCNSSNLQMVEWPNGYIVHTAHMTEIFFFSINLFILTTAQKKSNRFDIIDRWRPFFSLQNQQVVTVAT